MSTKQDLVEEYKAQMLRVYGMLPPNMAERIEAMSEEKLKRDFENIKGYPGKYEEPYYWTKSVNTLNSFMGLENNGDRCRCKDSCGSYSPKPSLNHCDPVLCLGAKIKQANSTVGDN